MPLGIWLIPFQDSVMTVKSIYPKSGKTSGQDMAYRRITICAPGQNLSTGFELETNAPLDKKNLPAEVGS